MSNLREAAYLALLGPKFIEDSLTEWQKSSNPSQRDFNLAFEIANGTCKRKLTLDYLAKQVVEFLPKKRRELILLEMTLYQIYFLERVPLYAIVSESVAIAKKHVSLPFSKFINAIFRNFEKKEMVLPKDLSIKYSYPQFFVGKLGKNAESILSEMNKVYPIQARVRADNKMIELEKVDPTDTSIYAQNGTFIQLIEELSSQLKEPPKKILDVASAPGGKLIALHDRFPKSLLFANDLRVDMLEENLKKYGISAVVTKGSALDLKGEYDLIICDLPCSNTGVLGKRPEARWRLDEKHIQEQQALQLSILQHAKTLLTPGGQLWYMTCSILKEENEDVASQVGLKKLFEKTHFPHDGFDGGYACALS